MRNNRFWASIDLETTGLDVNRHEPVELACQMYDPRTLDPVPESEGGLFHSFMAPTDWDAIQDRALQVNGLTREQLKTFPEPGPVWRRFCDWVKDFNPKKNFTTAPIAIGKNIRAFDLPILAATDKRHGKNREVGKTTLLFDKRTILDLEDQLLAWFEDDDDLASWKMDDIRPYLGLSSVNSHSAKTDCLQTGAVVMSFLRMQRWLRSTVQKGGEPLIKFQGAFKLHPVFGVCPGGSISRTSGYTTDASSKKQADTGCFHP